MLAWLTMFLLCTGTLFAQRTVTGKVLDDAGRPISNVSVVVKGSSRGSVTRDDGSFSLDLPATATVLSFSTIGFVTQDLTLGTGTTYEVRLKSTENTMDEVVVVGYGTQRRGDITGNISTVKGSDIANKPITSFDAALGGRAPGVQVTIPNGVLNNPPVIRIRGTNSLGGSAGPLYVIDGVVAFSGNASGTIAASNVLSNINPSDIESIDILKDGSATAIYGSRAASGVIIVTTKKGKRGKARVNYDGWVGWTSPYREIEMLDAEQYMMIKNEGLSNVGGAPRYFPSRNADSSIVNTDWSDLVYRTGLSHSHNVSVGGANENTSYFLSGGYINQQGILQRNDLDRKSIRFNADHKVNKWLSIGSNIGFTNEINYAAINSGSLDGSAFSSAGAGRLALTLPPNVAPFNPNGSYNLNGNALGRGANIENITFWNVKQILDFNYANTENNRLIGNVYGQIKPLEWLTFRTTYAVDYLNTKNNSFLNRWQGDGFSAAGSATSTLGVNKRWILTQQLNIDKTFGEDHSINFLAATETQRTTFEGFGLNRQTLTDNFFDVIQGGFTTPNTAGLGLGENTLVSYFGRIGYDYKKKYLLSATVRRDGYSGFGFDGKYGNFYGVSAAWDVAQEDFFEGVSDVMSTFKLRGSYGSVGNTSSVSDFAPYSLFGSGSYNGGATLTYNQAGNPDIQWETAKKVDLGVVFGLFNERVFGEFSYFKNTNDGLILNVQSAPSAGLPTNIPTNVGSMYNRGWELSLGASLIRNKLINWSTNFNITYTKNKVQELAPGVNFITTGTSGLETVNITRPGLPAGYLYVVETRGVDAQTGRRIFVNAAGREVLYDHSAAVGSRWRYREDGTIAPAINPGLDQKAWQQSSPKYVGGLDNTVRVQNFEVNAFLTFWMGGYVYNGTRASTLDQRFWNSTTDVLRRWQKAGDVTDIPRLVYTDNTSNGSAIAISDNVEKSNFLRLKNVSLAYYVPAAVTTKAGLQSIRLYASVQNAFLITDYRGYDPEVSSNGDGILNQGVDRNTVANGRTVTVGINVGF